MFKLAIIPILMLGPCGYDMAAAGIEVTDGGGLVAPYQTADGGYVEVPLPTDQTVRPLPDFPSMETICTLYIGDMNEMTDFPLAIGTWIRDVLDPRLLGPIEGAGDYKDDNGAQFRYTYKHPTIPMETASISLRFERVAVIDIEHYRIQDGKAWPEPFFLSGVSIQGLGGDQLPCLDWVLRDKEETHYTVCPWCAGWNQFSTCPEVDPRDCFR